MNLERIIDFYQTLTPESIEHLPDLYSANAYFKDPFNEVREVAAIQGIFAHMFRQVKEPRFLITDRIAEASCAMLAWEFSFCANPHNNGERQTIRGVSHLKFDPDGKISFHRDYWDAAEELYAKLPIIGLLMRGLRKKLSARGPS